MTYIKKLNLNYTKKVKIASIVYFICIYKHIENMSQKYGVYMLNFVATPNGQPFSFSLNQLPELTENDKSTIKDFISGERQYLSCLYSLHLGLLHLMVKQPVDEAIYPLVSRILHKKSLKQLCRQYGFTGQKQINLCIKILLIWFNHFGQRIIVIIFAENLI